MDKAMDKAMEKALAHARAAYPKEACGLMIIKQGCRRYRPCDNVAPDPLNYFAIAPEQFFEIEQEGDVVAVVHSHPDAEGYLSGMDSAMHKASGYEYIVIGLPDGQAGEPHVVTVPAEGPLPLKGRTYYHGVIDCYTVIRDYYQQVKGITLKDFIRPDDWWLKGMNLYEENFRSAGFIPVETPEDGDVILMQIRATVSNHAAIYLNGEMLHHMPLRLSSQDVYGDYYRERTTKYLRYVGEPDG